MNRMFMFFRCQYYKFAYWKNKYKLYERFHYKPKKYCGHEIYNTDEYLYNALINDKPLFFGRLGATENKAILYYLKHEYKHVRKYPQPIKYELSNNAGMFSNNNEGIDLFCNYQLNALCNLTGLRVWFLKGEELIIKRWGKKYTLIEMFREDNPSLPWEYALTGKKVLIVSAFSKSILKQYNIKDKLFVDKRRLPDFLLEVEDSVVSFCGTKTKFINWEEALVDTYKRCMKHDFDVVIIGAGSYSLPLGNMLFCAGKKVIVLNGDVTTMFGIYGERFLKYHDKSGLRNKYWVRPLEEETPTGSQKVDGGAYW